MSDYVKSGYWKSGYSAGQPVFGALSRDPATLTKKLLGYLHRVFDKTARQFLAIRIQYQGYDMAWDVTDGVLTTRVYGGYGSGFSVDLSQHTISSLSSFVAAQRGYKVLYSDAEFANLSARVLLQGASSQLVSNGDHLYGYTSLLWVYMESFAVELKEQSAQVDEALKQMDMRDSEEYWADEWGGYFGIPRNIGEDDSNYIKRVIVEVIRPRCNNVAIEQVATALLGQSVTVNDIRLWGPASPLHDGVHIHDGSMLHNATATPIYGLFDVDYVYNLESGEDVSGYALRLAEIIETMRAAGTHMRAMNLVSSNLSDTSALSMADTATIYVTTGVLHDGTVTHSGVAKHSGISTVSVALS